MKFLLQPTKPHDNDNFMCTMILRKQFKFESDDYENNKTVNI